MTPGTPEDMQPPAQPVSLQPLPHDVDWSKAKAPVAIAGAALGLISIVPVISIGCCLWAMGAGALAVVLYGRRANTAVTPGMGARLGAATGAAAYVIHTALFGLQMLVPPLRRAHLSNLRQNLERSAANNPDPNAQAIVSRLTSPEGITLMFVIMLLVTLFAFLLFTTLGGTLGASLFGKRQRS